MVELLPLSICIEFNDGRAGPVIERGTAIPVEKEWNLLNAENNQKGMAIAVGPF